MRVQFLFIASIIGAALAAPVAVSFHLLLILGEVMLNILFSQLDNGAAAIAVSIVNKYLSRHHIHITPFNSEMPNRPIGEGTLTGGGRLKRSQPTGNETLTGRGRRRVQTGDERLRVLTGRGTLRAQIGDERLQVLTGGERHRVPTGRGMLRVLIGEGEVLTGREMLRVLTGVGSLSQKSLPPHD